MEIKNEINFQFLILNKNWMDEWHTNPKAYYTCAE